MLPPGVKTLGHIRKQPDPITRVHEAKRLLEYILTAMLPDLTSSDGRDAYLSDRVRHLSKHFSNIPDVMFAIGVRNKLDHPSAEDEPPRDDEIDRAGQHLITAIENILPHAPKKLAADAGWKKPTKKKASKPKKKAQAKSGGVKPNKNAKKSTHHCPTCNRKFKTRSSLKQHTHDAHGPGPRKRTQAKRNRKTTKKKRGLLGRVLRGLFGG